MAWIRKTYGVPAKRGGVVEYRGEVVNVGERATGACEVGVIVSASGKYLRIRFGGEKNPGLYHPTWRMAYRGLQCKDIPDGPILDFFAKDAGKWRTHWDGFDNSVPRHLFRFAPEKLVRAKLRRLLERGLIDGCPCGCRGDWRRPDRTTIQAGGGVQIAGYKVYRSDG